MLKKEAAVYGRGGGELINELFGDVKGIICVAPEHTYLKFVGVPRGLPF